METVTNQFTRVEYNSWSGAIFSGFYESELYNSDTLYYLTENDRGQTQIDENGNEVPILKDDEGWDFTENGWHDFQIDVCKYATDKLEELATEYKSEDELIVKNFEFTHMYSPKYYNYETDKLDIMLDVNIEKLEKFCFEDHADEFNRYLNKYFTSYDGFISYIDNNLKDFKNTYDEKGFDSTEGNAILEYYLLTCIYETADICSVEDRSQDEYRYHYDLAEYANNAIWNYIEPTKVE